MRQLVVVAVLVVVPQGLWSPTPPNPCLTEAVWQESRGEPLESQVMVVDVVVNRSLVRNKSYCEVVWERGQFSWTKTWKGWNVGTWDYWLVIEKQKASGSCTCYQWFRVAKDVGHSNLVVGNMTFYCNYWGTKK